MTVAQAQARQREIDSLRGPAEVAADVDELLANGASPRALKVRIRSGAALHGLDDAARNRLSAAVDDPDGLRRAVDELLAASGLEREDEIGRKVALDRRRHDPLGQSSQGDTVVPFTTGVVATLSNGEKLYMVKAKTERYDPDVHGPLGPPPVEAGVARGQATANRALPTGASLQSATVEQLLDAAGDLSRREPTAEVGDALLLLDAELARREGVDALTFEANPTADRVDELVGRGYSYTDAYAEVHGLNAAQLATEQRLSIVDRRPGETRTQAIRRMYKEFVYMQYMDAEEATRGNLLTGEAQRRHIDPSSLWSGTATRARKYASEELKRWWEAHGGRVTFTQWSAQFTGDRAAAEASRLAGSGRDFGV